ncbi:MAG: penicillin-binding transpeptidase domain-containing protein [Rhizobiaceae bacterium]
MIRFLRRSLPTLALLLWFSASALAEATTVCTLVVDAKSGASLLEDGDCDTRVTPASTFKVPLAVIGFDSGFLKDSNHPRLAFRPGDPDWGGAAWRQDNTPANWMRYSVVWYSQRITHALGTEVLGRYTRALAYGNADFSGDAGFDNGLDRAWIASSLAVSPREQTSSCGHSSMTRCPSRRMQWPRRARSSRKDPLAHDYPWKDGRRLSSQGR